MNPEGIITTVAGNGLIEFNGDGGLATSTQFTLLGAVDVGPNGDLYISGSSGTHPTFNTQLIGNNVEVSGGATIDINFNDDENFEQPPYLDLLK